MQRISLTAGLAIALSLAALPVFAAERRAPARLVQASSDRVVFRIDVPTPEFAPSSLAGFESIRIRGFSTEGEPGQPGVPSRVFLVAIPPDGAVSVSARVVEAEPRANHRIEPYPAQRAIRSELLGDLPGETREYDADAYRGWMQPPLAVAEDIAFIRHQRVLPVRVSPVSYDPATGDVSVASQIEVTVLVSGGRRSAELGRAPRGETQAWGETFGRLLVNPYQAEAWRVPLPEQGLAAPQSPVRVVAGAVKLHVRETAVHKVKASTAIAAGFPAGQALANLRVFTRRYSETTFSESETDVPFFVIEDPAGTAGTFDGNDVVVFYGLRLRDDNTQDDRNEQFSAWNVYWLEPSAGTGMATRTVGAGFVTADTSSAAFQATRRFEQDNVFVPQPPTSAVDVYAYNFGDERTSLEIPFDLGALMGGTTATLSAELTGWSYRSPRLIRLSLVNTNGTLSLNAAYPVPGKTRRLFTASIPAENYAVGENRFRIERPDAQDPRVDIVHNWITVNGQFRYRARGNQLAFNTGTLAGDTSVTVTGLQGSTGFELVDVTSPGAPVRVNFPAGSLQPVGGGFAFSFRENIPARRDLVLVSVAKMTEIVAADVVADQMSAIIGSSAESGIDVLVVSYATFIPQMQQWASYRRAQGYRVYVVDVEDVFDEFNGGIPSPQAVFRFTRHFYERGNAGTLLLVGDSSKDQKRVHSDSGPNFVPAYYRIDTVSSLAQDEVVTVDKRFVKMPGPSGIVDVFPDLVVGRLPVGSTGELSLILDKTFKYERPAASDFWRKRMIMFSDDTYSAGGSSFGSVGQFCNTPVEIGFRSSQTRAAATIKNALPAGYDVVEFFLADYTSAFYTTDCASQFSSISYTRRNVTELLMNELHKGATLVTMQAHMNRSLVTHESVLSSYSASLLDGGTGRDHLRMQNIGKPWIIFGMGCHFSDYSVHRELNSLTVSNNNPNGDAFAEQLLFQNDRAAVGTYGSTGFEYLTPNANYMERTMDVWFYEAPYDTMVNQTQGQWIFGDLMFLTESLLAISQRDPVERYIILGDPLLRIDAGPPAFEVTVDGEPVQSGVTVESGGEGDSIQVVATVTDENAIRDFKLTIDDVDQTSSMTIEALVDQALPRARQYRLSFKHKLRPEDYDIVLRAFQAPDTIAGQYHLAAEFTLKVESSILVSVNGRTVASGATVPASGKYRIDLAFPVFVPSSQIELTMDDDVITDANLSHPSAEDSLVWIATFNRTLGPGRHVLHVRAGTIEFVYNLVVSETPGLRNVINFPNPFRGDGTSIVFFNDVEIIDGSVDIYTVSGKRIRRLEIPFSSRFPGQNAVFWDGRDTAGDKVANGTYLYVIEVSQRVGDSTTRGKMTRIE